MSKQIDAGAVTVYITKYALSDGIWFRKCEPGSSGDTVRYDWTFFHGEGREWHRTPESALRRAEEMRIAKIASLRKQIAKLEKMTFTISQDPKVEQVS